MFTSEEPAQTKSPGEQPLAARMRPMNFDEYVGQKHILAEGKLLRRAIDSDSFTSLILSGPPGVGKTSIAELIAKMTNAAFIRLSGVASSVGDIRNEIATAIVRRKSSGRKTILFIDEIHRFNRAQQDVLLPDIENGNIRFIGATTQNPFFYVNGPLLSRSLVFKLEALSEEDIHSLITRTITDKRGFPDKKIKFQPESLTFLSKSCEGDARRALNAIEIAVMTTKPDKKGIINISPEIAHESIQEKPVEYGDDGHYDTASAFIKSMRGSDPDAAVYWLAKMLHAGEDIRFIARRIVIFASEDVGNADPRAITVALNAMQAVEMIGMPEARIILAQAVTYCATAPKSNASYMAVDAALDDVKNERVQAVPKHLRDSHYKGSKTMGHGEGYVYPHGKEGHFAVQEYLGVSKKYYAPSENGYESKIKERIEYWDGLRKENEGKG
ncbi:MAG: AAA family ATPase [Lentisphaerae bacterium GWF2_49_21]|nr:MAG: AAA family ATPase [Lentisphaerae bacterium GWF2_49_21]